MTTPPPPKCDDCKWFYSPSPKYEFTMISRSCCHKDAIYPTDLPIERGDHRRRKYMTNSSCGPKGRNFEEKEKEKK